MSKRQLQSSTVPHYAEAWVRRLRNRVACPRSIGEVSANIPSALRQPYGFYIAQEIAKIPIISRFVAVKVSCGTDKPLFSREADILLHIKEHGGAHRGFENILTLHEAFIISGPNGMHECLVTEVVAPSEGLGITQGWTRKMKLEQIASGMSLLHSQGIAHGGKYQHLT